MQKIVGDELFCKWRNCLPTSGTVVWWLSLLHNFIQLSLNSGSAQAQTLLGVSEIRDGEDLWQWSRLEIRLNTFRRSTIPQKQFIIIITDDFFYGRNFMPTFFLPSYLCLKRMFFRVFFKFETLMSLHSLQNILLVFHSISLCLYQFEDAYFFSSIFCIYYIPHIYD